MLDFPPAPLGSFETWPGPVRCPGFLGGNRLTFYPRWGFFAMHNMTISFSTAKEIVIYFQNVEAARNKMILKEKSP